MVRKDITNALKKNGIIIPMGFVSTETLFMMEDRIMKTRGLYFMSFCCYVGSLVCLAADGHEAGHEHAEVDPCRDFLLYTSLLSTIYWSISSANTIYGNGKPSSMIMVAGPIHQFSFWLLLAYYRGNVYGKEPAGVMNTVHTALVGTFNLDLLVKTWLLACAPHKYLQYVFNSGEEGATVEESGEAVAAL